MTDDEFEKIVDAFVWKAEQVPFDGTCDVRGIIATAVADTVLVIENGMNVDDWPMT